MRVDALHGAYEAVHCAYEAHSAYEAGHQLISSHRLDARNGDVKDNNMKRIIYRFNLQIRMIVCLGQKYNPFFSSGN